jgi:hypothetical protein
MEQYKPPQGVYFLYNDGELVYVGQTNDIFRRISEHSRSKKRFTWWQYFEINDENLRKAIEYMFIRVAKPKYNEDLRFMCNQNIKGYDNIDLSHKVAVDNKELLKQMYERCIEQFAS